MNDQRKYYEEKEIHRKEGKKKMRGKEKAKRFLALLLAFSMIFTSSSMNVLAATIIGGYKNSDKQTTEVGDADQSETQASETQTPETNEDGTEVRLNTVTFSTDGHAHVVINGATVDSTANARDGKIVFDVAAENGYAIESVLVDKSIPARTQEDGSYIIEGILTDETTVDVTTVAVETESESETESETEAAMPEFTKSGTCDGITANVHAEEGVFPEGTELELKALTEDQKAAMASAAGCEATDILGLDITFKYEGKEIQPEGPVSVTFAAAEIATTDVDTVYHINDGGAVEEVEANQNGESLGFTSDSFSPYGVAVTSENNENATYTVKVGETITIQGTSGYYDSYYSSWESDDNSVASVSPSRGASSTEVTGKKSGRVTITHKYTTYTGYRKNNTETFTVLVVSAEEPTALSISGADTVKAFSSISLTPVFTPSNAHADVIWSSSKTNIATVDANGIVTGVSAGTTTITALATGKDDVQLIATKEVTVERVTETTDDSQFYYLLTPTSDPASNDTTQWGPNLGTGTVNVTNATWENNKNTFANVGGRVVSWPSGIGTDNGDGTLTLTANSTAWNNIFENYKTSVENEVGMEITKDDIESITLIPYKISKNNYSTPDKHVDCTVSIKCKKIVTATYKLWDVGSTGYVFQEAYNYRANAGRTTEPTKSYPTTKTVGGKQYTLVGWYDNEALSGEAVSFPYVMEGSNKTFYAKYVRSDLKYTVNYYLNGTTTKVALSKTESNLSEGATAIESPIDITGYTKVSGASQTITIGSGTNEINFYYYKNVTLTANSDTKTYNGQEQSVSGYTYTGAPEGVKFSGVTAGATGIDVGEYPATFSEGTVGKVDTTEKYFVEKVEDGQLVITPKETQIVITAASDKKVYDGTALTNDGYTYTEGVLESGDVLTAVVEGSRTNAGSSANAVTGYKVMRDGTDVTGNYTFGESVNGTLEVTKRGLSITADSDSKEYDGTALTKNSYAITGGSLAAGDALKEVTVSGSIVNKGTEANVAGNAVIKNAAEEDVTGNYDISYNDGQLEITARPLTITADSDGKTYDGTPLTKNSYTVTNGTLAGGDRIASVEIEGSITYAGSVPNVAKNAVIRNAAEEDATGNYAITYVAGTLTVSANENEIIITADSDSKEYDGTPLTKNSYSYTQGVLAEGDVLTAVVEGSITEVGTADNVVTSYKVMRGNKDVTDQYTFRESVNGTLEVTKRGLSITAGSDIKEYDGTALTKNSYAITSGTLADGDAIGSVKVEGSITDVGTKPNVASDAVIKRGDKDVTGNYEISYKPGTLEITKKAAVITITAASDEKVYDGTALTNDGYTYTEGVLESGDVLTAVVEGSQTNAGSSANVVTGYKVMRDGTDVTGNYTFGESVNGTLEVTKRPLTVTANDKSAKYTGSEIKADADGYTVSAETPVADGETVSVAAINGGKTYVGEYEDELTISKSDVTISRDGVDVTANYEIATVLGKLTITGDPIIPEKTTPEVTSNYKLGDEIPFTITVKNVSKAAAKDITVTDPDATIVDSDDYDIVAGAAKISVLEPGAEVKVNAVHVVTEADILAGTVDNHATVKAEDKEYPVTAKTNDIEGVDTTLVVEKTSDVAEGTAAKLDQVITYTIKVTNKGNVTYKNVVVEDELEGLTITGTTKGVIKGRTVKINALAVGDTVEITATYKVTEADITAGQVINVATAKADPVKDPKEDTTKVPENSGSKTDLTDKSAPSLGVVKEASEPKDGKAYTLGEKVTYTITVTNNGNVTIKDIVVEDALTGLKENVKQLKPIGSGTSTENINFVKFTTTHTITQEDILKGTYVNVATAKGTDPSGNPVEGEDEESITPEDINTTLTVKKISDVAENAKAALGQTIHYTITVKNDGNVDYSNVVVTDKLAGLKNIKADAENATVSEDGTVTIPTLAVGQTVSITGEYTVTTEDILNGSVLNTVTVKGDDIPDPKDPEKPKTPEGGDEVEDITEDPNPSVAITKETTSKPADAAGYAEAEKITYKIQATNTGNVTLHDVVITDEKTGDTWNVGTLEPNATTDAYDASYKVTQEDILVGEVENTAVIVGIPEQKEKEAEIMTLGLDEAVPDNTDTVTDSATVKDPTVKKSSALQVTKTVTSKGSTITVDGKDVTGYRVGDTIEYNIHVKNTGNLTLTNVVVNDVPTLATGSPNGSIVIAPSTDNTYTVDGSKATIATLTPGAEVDIKASYLVMAGDGTLKGNELSNAAFVTGTSPDKDNPQPGDSSKTDPAPIEPEPDEGNGAMEGSITVTKMITTSDGKTPKDGVDAVIKVGLYDNASFSGQPIKTNTITISRGTSGNTVFDELDNTAGTVYYVAELDENGKPIVGGSAHLKGYGVPSYSANCKAGINPTTTKDTAASIVNPLAADSTGNGDKNDNSNSSTTSNNSNTSTSTKAAKTGDNTNMMLYWMLLGMAILAGCVAVVYRKRKER